MDWCCSLRLEGCQGYLFLKHRSARGRQKFVGRTVSRWSGVSVVDLRAAHGPMTHLEPVLSAGISQAVTFQLPFDGFETVLDHRLQFLSRAPACILSNLFNSCFVVPDRRARDAIPALKPSTKLTEILEEVIFGFVQLVEES